MDAKFDCRAVKTGKQKKKVPQRGNISNMSKNTDMGQVVNGGFSF